MTDKSTYTVVFSIAGSDSGGGAGIQGDLKTISALGCYGATAITAVTAQNTMGVTAIFAIPPEIVSAQIVAIMEDMTPSAIKIGMVYSAELASILVSTLRSYTAIPIIFDPVMVATSGHQLIKEDTLQVLKQGLFPICCLITPNLDEACILAAMDIRDVEDMKIAAKKIIQFGSFAVLVKGGHLGTEHLYDVYLDKTGTEHVFRSKSISSKNGHGTGCSLSSAIAAYLAMGETLIDSIDKAKSYVHEAIHHGKDVMVGSGYGPINHFFEPKKMLKNRA